MDTHIKEPFKISLTMAGAVSAGAYTAGVIDYLLETLHLWQEAKDRNRAIQQAHPKDYLKHGYNPTVPMHDVQLEVIGGASAGGITGSLMVLALAEGITVSKDGDYTSSKLYNSWVDMADEAGETTMHKLLSTSDITETNTVESLLNSLPIDELANKRMQVERLKGYPPYVSPNLDLLLTVSNLRGVKFRIDFRGRDQDSGNYIINHSGFFRYRLENEVNSPGIPDSGELYYVLKIDEDPEKWRQDRHNLRDATLATAAFPIGLKPRWNSIPTVYLDRYAQYLFSDSQGIHPILPDNPNFRFVSVDGGLINNEPFGYTFQIMKEKFPLMETKGNYAIIMVDPFPDTADKIERYEMSTDILSVAQLVFQVLRNQVLFKQDDILAALNDLNDTRFMIAPSRKTLKLNKMKGVKEWMRSRNPIACGALGGFSGFLDRSFRNHDYILGRQNCQSFLRYYFAIPEEEVGKKLNAPILKAARDRFSFSIPPHKKASEGGNFFFPIIPDMRVLRAFDNTYDTANYPVEAQIQLPAFPQLSMDFIEKHYGSELQKRIQVIRKQYFPGFSHNILAWLAGVDRRIYAYLRKAIEEGLKDGGVLRP